MARRAKHDVNDRGKIYHKVDLSRLIFREVGSTQHLDCPGECSPEARPDYASCMDAPKIEFPCDYPIKVMARADPGVREHVDAVLARHAGPRVIESVAERPSGQGNFVGLTYIITARDAEHIAALFADLKTIAGVLMVL